MIISAFQRSAPAIADGPRAGVVTGEVGLVTIAPRAPGEALGFTPTARPTGRLPAATREDPEPTPMWRRVASAAFTLAILAIVVLLWPARLGGATRLVIVTGDSMEPTYEFGDIVVTRDQGTPDVGDIVVFAVPNGQAEGILVIHRVTQHDEAGIYRTQGDNRDRPDSWDLTRDDIVGTPLLRLPKGGYVAWYLQQWWVVAVVVGLLAFFLLWPDEDEDEEAEEDVALHEPLLPLAATARLRALVPRTEPTHDAPLVRVAEPEIPSLLGPLFDPLLEPTAEPLPVAERTTDRVPVVRVWAETVERHLRGICEPGAGAVASSSLAPLFDPLVTPIIRPLVEPTPTEMPEREVERAFDVDDFEGDVEPSAAPAFFVDDELDAVMGTTIERIVVDDTQPLPPFAIWSDHEFDERVMADAAAWLQRQLGEFAAARPVC